MTMKAEAINVKLMMRSVLQLTTPLKVVIKRWSSSDSWVGDQLDETGFSCFFRKVPEIYSEMLIFSKNKFFPQNKMKIRFFPADGHPTRKRPAEKSVKVLIKLKSFWIHSEIT